ncbi:MAG: glutamate racemase [Acidobacteria bacterium]|nr:glutamate racemase [Acidobacteriota bacterium]
MDAHPPILIFDSGVGGLSVLDAVRKALPHETYRYACDNAAFPYGPKPEDELVARVDAVLTALIARIEPKMVIVACNTASTVALPRLRAKFPMPIIGVVPAIKPAAGLSGNKVIGLLATPGTVTRRYTDDLIREFAPHCDVIRVGSRELVVLAEAKLRGEAIDIDTLREILSPFFQEAGRQADTIVLGCTHFPLLLDELRQAAPQVKHWVDSGEAIARRAASLLPEAETEAGISRAIFTADEPSMKRLAAALAEHGLVQIDIIPIPN